MLDTLVIASHNVGKVRELEALLAPYGVVVKSAADFDLPEPDETGLTFAENAEIKARAAADAVMLPVLADDSGLAVAALDGAPGIYSARWGGANKDFAMAMDKVRVELEAVGTSPDGAEAAFVCALCMALPDDRVHHVEGRVEGMLTFPPRGDQGFGYDPIFIPVGYTRTFGEMRADEKRSLSHRARAFDTLVERYFKDTV